ncbi:MAG: hypothetical protein UU87_C0002G0035 [Parcubacteria group bacterium GW2011_GWA2_42_11]|nr:MAG: hypothetical protein UU87_C0002G0035 [Parcubacteria group bacterium GW2011_GWA2_42_11]
MSLGKRKEPRYYSTFAVFDKNNRRGKKINWRFFFWGCFFILLFGGGAYLLFFSPFFQIREINISGQNVLAAEQVRLAVQNELDRKILKFIPGDRSPAFGERQIAEKIKDDFSEIASVEVNKILPDKLEIKITERQAAAVWCRAENILQAETATSTKTAAIRENQKNTSSPEGDDCFFINEDGIAYRSAPQLSGSLMPVFFGPASINLKEQVVSSSTVAFAVSIKKELRSNGINLTGLLVKNTMVAEAVALIDEGWLVYFDINRPTSEQVKILAVLLKEELKNRENLQYIDLRIDGRVYYK